MSAYPTPSEYQEAVQFPETAFADEELQTATPKTNVLGLPQPITGAFAAVFPMTTETGVRYAVKCFLADVPDQQRHYAAVARHLEDAALDATVEFAYQPKGIDVDGTRYPVLKMEWAEGTALNRFVERHLDAPDVLRALARAWRRLLQDLNDAGLAHGDLQHGNVLVQSYDADEDLRLRLVDYDATYVPELDGAESREVGHRNYQHPDRTEVDFGPYLDRFSGLAIYVALRALATRPDLWERYDTGENLLFRDADFYAPESSPLFQDLAAVDDLQDLVGALRTSCFVEPEDVPALADVMDGGVPDAVGVDRTPRRSRDASRRVQRGAFAGGFLPGGVAVLAVVGAAMGLGAPAVGVVIAGLALVACGGLVATHYQRLPIVRRRRRLRREADRFTRLIETRRREIDSLKQKRKDVLASVESRREARLTEVQDEALYDRLKHHFIGEAREVEGVTHKHVVRLKAANLRTAYEITRASLRDVSGISNETRARLRQWRASLAQSYADAIPDELSPAEDRRLQRYVQHRVEDVDAQVARAQEKIEVFRTERDAVRERLDALPVVTVGRYVGYLLRLRALPAMDEGRPEPSVPASEPIPEPTAPEDDRPWWQSA